MNVFIFDVKHSYVRLVFCFKSTNEAMNYNPSFRWHGAVFYDIHQRRKTVQITAIEF